MNASNAFTVASLAVFLSGVVTADERESQITTLRPGVTLSLVAEHPDLATPTGIDVDAQGRIWVVATHTHFRPDDYVGPEHDEVLIFSDKDGDGKAEKRELFYSATDATMDLELGEDGWVYLAERDRIVRIKDSDNDGKADVEEDVVTLKTTADYPHNGLEALAWHPDGTLVFGLGENFATPWILTGPDATVIRGTGEGGIFRCSPDGKQLRRIAKGFWNPFGICVRKDGEIFAAENDPGERPPCRLLHIMQGGDYGYQRSYGPGAHHPFVGWNGELRGTLPMIHPVGEAPCGIMPLGNGLIVPSWSDHRIDFYRLQQNGASFKAERTALVQGGRYFRPSCIAGSDKLARNDLQKRIWYLSDWVDGRYQAHGYGRLWKLEVDLETANWIGDLPLQPPTNNARRVEQLRNPALKHETRTLLRESQDEDPFLARAALLALSKEAGDWTQSVVAEWPAADRIQASLALKIANAAPSDWVPTLLQDENAEVQFETLRWIADSNLTSFLPNVETYLNRSDLDYSRFEAAVATWNTLNGKPEDGIRNPELLLARVMDDQSAANVRAFALRLLPRQSRRAPKIGDLPVRNFSNGLNIKILQQLLSVDDELLSMEAVRTLAGNPPVSQQLLASIAADRTRSPNLRAEAITGLADVANQHTDLLLQLADADQKPVREEALRCLRNANTTAEQIQALKKLAAEHPSSRDLFQAVITPDAIANHHPAAGNIEAWVKAIDAVDGVGDPRIGRRIFHHSRVAQCARCHRHNGHGNVVGPDLSRVHESNDRTWLLQSILEPSRQMAPEYLPRTVVLKSGKTFTGIRLRSSTKEVMRDSNGQTRSFDRDQIESIIESTVSFMPKDIAKTLTLRELRDLIAFLQYAPENE